MADLGGGEVHNRVSGVAHYLGEDESDAIDYARTVLVIFAVQQRKQAAGLRLRRHPRRTRESPSDLPPSCPPTNVSPTTCSK